MLNKRWLVLGGSTVIFLAGLSAGSLLQSGIAHAQAARHVYEIRTYTAPEGKLGELHARFRDHTIRIFNKHGMKSVVYLSPQDAPDSANTLIYVLEHPSREAAKKAWADFTADPEWVKVSADSQVNGRIVSKVVSVFADPTDYSPLK
jgi:NIPSNAP protein